MACLHLTKAPSWGAMSCRYTPSSCHSSTTSRMTVPFTLPSPWGRCTPCSRAHSMRYTELFFAAAALAIARSNSSAHCLVGDAKTWISPAPMGATRNCSTSRTAKTGNSLHCGILFIKILYLFMLSRVQAALLEALLQSIKSNFSLSSAHLRISDLF